jgi:anion-transporting  ArsA/GET3 family ATPase
VAEPGEPRSIFEPRRRLWIVTGKGGTGRTTVAAALALLAARAGLRVLVVSASGAGALPSALDLPEDAGTGREPIELTPQLSALFIAPEDSLAEYVDMQLHVGGIGRRLLESRAFGAFLDAAPGWRDLVILGKLWHLEQQRESGRPRFELIVLDAPATGHGVSMLSTPQAVLDVAWARCAAARRTSASC